MKSKIAIGLVLIASTLTSFASITIPAGNGTFTSQGETDLFNLHVASSGVLEKVTITLTAAASQTGTLISNNDTNAAIFDGSIQANYATTLLGFIGAGTVTLSDSQSQVLAPSASAIYNVSDSDTLVIDITNPAVLAFFTSLSPGTGSIQATTLGSSFTVTTNPIGTAYGVAGGSSFTNYTWDVTYTVPEPSVALLGGIGMIGLLRRRRA